MSKRPLFLAVILFVLSMSAFAQQNMCKVTGKVIVEENSQMPYVSVYASLQDSVVAGTLTDQNGQFTLKVPQSPKTYTLTVVWMGYKTKHIDFTADKTELALGTVQLEAMSQVLDEVSISAQGERDNIITASCMTISNFGATDEMGGTIADLLR